MSKNAIAYVARIGFVDPIPISTKNSSNFVLAFSFASFDPVKVRQEFGKHLKFSNDGLFIFKMAPDRAARVNTEKKTLLLVSGRNSVNKLVKRRKKHA